MQYNKLLLKLSFDNLNEDLNPYLTSWEQQVASGVRGCSYVTGWASVAPTVVQRDYCLPLHCATHPGSASLGKSVASRGPAVKLQVAREPMCHLWPYLRCHS